MQKNPTLLFIKNRPTLDTIEERLTNISIAEKSQRKAFLNIIKKKKGVKKVLSVSAGNGIWDYLVFDTIRSVNEIVATDIVKCPINKEDVKKLKEMGDWRFKKVKPEKQLPFKDNYFDIVMHFDVVEHVEKPHFFLKEQHRVLKPKGTIIVSTPNLLRTMNIAKLLTGKLRFPIVTEFKEEFGEMSHIQEFTQWNIENYLEEVGFKKVQTKHVFFGVLPLNLKISDFPQSSLGKLLCHILMISGSK